MTFPSFYTYFYVYYFRFIKGDDVTPELNDAIDLVNCLPVPYCERYYAERTYTNVLKQVQNRTPPSVFAIAKRLYARKGISREVWEGLRQNKTLRQVYPLIPSAQVYSFSDLRRHLERPCAS